MIQCTATVCLNENKKEIKKFIIVQIGNHKYRQKLTQRWG